MMTWYICYHVRYVGILKVLTLLTYRHSTISKVYGYCYSQPKIFTKMFVWQCILHLHSQNIPDLSTISYCTPIYNTQTKCHPLYTNIYLFLHSFFNTLLISMYFTDKHNLLEHIQDISQNSGNVYHIFHICAKPTGSSTLWVYSGGCTRS